jgi:Protein of unknown function (DUF1570)
MASELRGRGIQRRAPGFAALAVGLTLAGLLLSWSAPAPAADDKPAGGDWKFDLIYHRNGAVFRGLVLDETPAGVRFQNVRRQPGRPTVVITTTFARGEILRVEKLSDADRDLLKARLQEIDPSGRGERQRMEKLELEPIPWDGRADAGRRYESEFFTLESDAHEGIVRRTVVRLEQIYAAYARYLPPRCPGRRPTAIILLRSRAEYEARLKALGLRFVNVAYYDPVANRIVCASDLDQLGQELDRLREKHAQLRRDLDRQEAILVKLYKGKKDLARHVQPIRDLRQKIDQADRKNEAVFDQATKQLFAVLYHEAFHAYLTGCVYPPPGPEPPRWLNEGLAQIFETAIVEAGDLRLGHADGDRLARTKDAVRKNELVPVERLLRAEAKQFQAAHAGDRSATGQYYLTAWAVAFHLTFERRLLGTTQLDDYVRAHAADADPRAAFEALVGCAVTEYEQELRRYLTALQPDGTAGGLTDK